MFDVLAQVWAVLAGDGLEAIWWYQRRTNWCRELCRFQDQDVYFVECMFTCFCKFLNCKLVIYWLTVFLAVSSVCSVAYSRIFCYDLLS